MRAGISLFFLFLNGEPGSKDLPTTTQWSINAIDNSSSFAYAGMWRSVMHFTTPSSVFAGPFMQKIPGTVSGANRITKINRYCS